MTLVPPTAQQGRTTAAQRTTAAAPGEPSWCTWLHVRFAGWEGHSLGWDGMDSPAVAQPCRNHPLSQLLAALWATRAHKAQLRPPRAMLVSRRHAFGVAGACARVRRGSCYMDGLSSKCALHAAPCLQTTTSRTWAVKTACSVTLTPTRATPRMLATTTVWWSGWTPRAATVRAQVVLTSAGPQLLHAAGSVCFLVFNACFVAATCYQRCAAT